MGRKGMALIVTLITVLIVLLLGSIIVYLSLKGTQISATYKEYRAALMSAEAGFNEAKYIIGYVRTYNKLPQKEFSCNIVNSSVFEEKLLVPTIGHPDIWNANVQNPDNVEASPDIVCKNIGNYNIYMKLINMVKGNTSLENTKMLNAAGVTSGAGGGSTITPPTIPYLYNFVIEAKNISTGMKFTVFVLYGY